MTEINKLSAIAVDDEPNALEIIRLYSDKISSVSLLKTFRDPLDAIDWLKQNPVDIIFLDINMPHLSGLKFRSLVGDQPMIIFTTAYAEYGAQSYEYNAVDYLLKPVSFDRFLKSVHKARDYKEQKHFRTEASEPVRSGQNDQTIYLKSSGKFYRLKAGDILYVFKEGNYVTFHTAEQKILTRLTMSEVLELLPADSFLRVHKSWVVNFPAVEVIESHQVIINGQAIPVAKSYREAVMEWVR